MKPKTEQKLLAVWMPATAVFAAILTFATLIVYDNISMGASVTMTVISAVAWLAVCIEFMLVYEALVDRWFSKERSVWAASWFVISILLAFILSPHKHVGLTSFIIGVLLFCAIFFIPYFLFVKFGDRILRPLYKRMPKSMTATQQTTASYDEPELSHKQKEQQEKQHYREAIDAIPKKVLATMPEQLTTDDAKFLLVLFAENGYLDSQFMPVITKDQVNINKSLYAFLANVISDALLIKHGKWDIFGEWWEINRPAQLLSDYIKANEKQPNDRQRDIARIIRMATRLRPKLDTSGIKLFKNKY